MARFSQIVAGKRARKTVEFPLPGAHFDASTGTWLGETHRLDVRVLTAGEQVDIFAKARATAISRGVADPGDGDPIYDLLVMVNTLAIACVDVDDLEKLVPYFTSPDEILAAPELTRDHIVFLYEAHVSWQDECSPRVRTMSDVEAIWASAKMAESSDADAIRFLYNMAPSMRTSLMLFLVRQWWTSPTLNSDSSLNLPESEPSPPTQ